MFLCVIGCICLCICVCVLCICFRASWSLCREDAAAVLGAKEEWGQRPATPTSRRTISWNQKKKTFVFIILVFFIGLKSNPCLAGPVSQSVSQWPCWDLTHVPLACEDSPKLSLHVELNILICQSCYFVKVVTWICQSCYMYFKQNQNEAWPIFWRFATVSRVHI